MTDQIGAIMKSKSNPTNEQFARVSFLLKATELRRGYKLFIQNKSTLQVAKEENVCRERINGQRNDIKDKIYKMENDPEYSNITGD